MTYHPTEPPTEPERSCTLLAAGKRMIDRLADCPCIACHADRLEVNADVAAMITLWEQSMELRRRLVQVSQELAHAAAAGYSAKQAEIVAKPHLEGALRMSMPLVVGKEGYPDGPAG